MTYTSTSRYVAILPYVLMEYEYTVLPTPEEYPVNVGPTTVGFEKIYNGYYKTNQILNRLQDLGVTGNTRNTSVVQIGDSTFVDLSNNYFTQYLDFDHNLTPTANLAVTFPVNIVVWYDTIKFHFLSGYNFPSTDGVIFQVKYKENSGKNTVVAQELVLKGDTSKVLLNPDPIYYSGAVYDKYVQVKVPSLANMCSQFDAQNSLSAKAETLAGLISTDGGGFTTGAPFTVTPYEINTTSQVNGYYTYVANLTNIATINPYDEFSYLAANLVENVDGNYWEYYPTWQGEFIEQFIYTENSLGNLYYLLNQIVVSEQVGLRLIETSRFQTVQNSGFDAPLIFRPIVTNSKATSFVIDYTATLVNKITNTSIIRRATVTSTKVDLYGAGLNKIQLNNDPYPLKVYNKVVESSKITSAYQINVNPINSVVTKYVPAFFEMENISVSEQDISITAIGSTGQTSSMDGTVAYGQGNLRIVVNPFDNYYKFRIFNSVTGAENTVLDLGNNSSYYLVFHDGPGVQIKVPSLTDQTFQNPSKGEIAFRVVEADSKTIQNYSSRDFHITALSPNGIETSLYYGTWLLPSERSMKMTGSSGSSGAASTAGSSGGSSSGSSGSNYYIKGNNLLNTVNQNVLTNATNTVFDVVKDNLLASYPTTNTSGSFASATAGTSGSTGISTPASSVVTLANAIRGDEALGKSYCDIADYYTNPSKPGYQTYKASKIFFLNAVNQVHPGSSGMSSDAYLAYSDCLGISGSSGMV